MRERRLYDLVLSFLYDCCPKRTGALRLLYWVCSRSDMLVSHNHWIGWIVLFCSQHWKTDAESPRCSHLCRNILLAVPWLQRSSGEYKHSMFLTLNTDDLLVLWTLSYNHLALIVPVNPFLFSQPDGRLNYCLLSSRSMVKQGGSMQRNARALA